MTTQKFKITHITCGACVKLSTMALSEIPGVTNVAIDEKTGQVTLEADKEIDWALIEATLKSVGKNAVRN